MTRNEQILLQAQAHFKKVHPELSIHTVDGKQVRDPYYLDHPERSDTMSAYIAAAEWADTNPLVLPTCSMVHKSDGELIASLGAKLTGVENALKEILDCPRWLDEATVPKAGIDKASEQVVFNASIGYLKIHNALAILKKAGK